MRRPRLPRPHLPRPHLPRPYRLRPRRPRARLARPHPPAARLPHPRAPAPVRTLARVVGRALRAIAAVRALADRWRLIDVYLRRRLAVLVVTAAAVAAFAVVAVPALPCRFPGGARCPQADRAIALVPADALAYAHIDIDPSSDQYREAAALAGELPMISRQVVARVEASLPIAGPAGLKSGGARAGWLGSELAVAVVPTAGRPTTVELLAAADQAAARRFARSLPADRGTEQYRGIELRSGVKISTAMVEGFLVAGPPAAVRRVIDVATGALRSPALADDAGAHQVRASLPDPRFADVYLSRRGLAAAMSDPGAPLRALAPLFVPQASTGATVALVASDRALDVTTRSLFDRSLDPVEVGSLSLLPPFTPTLAGELPAGSLAYLGIGRATGAVRVALADSTGILRSVAQLLGGIKPAQLGALARRLVPALGDEAALAVAPPVLTAGVATEPPQLQFVAEGVDAKQARKALARLHPTPPNELSGGRLLMAGAPSALAAVRSPTDTLDGSPLFKAATDGLPATPSVEAYLDLSGLRPLFESAGLAANPAYPAFAGEVRRLQALGVAVETGPATLGTDLRLVVAGSATVANSPDRR